MLQACIPLFVTVMPSTRSACRSALSLPFFSFVWSLLANCTPPPPSLDLSINSILQAHLTHFSVLQRSDTRASNDPAKRKVAFKIARQPVVPYSTAKHVGQHHSPCRCPTCFNVLKSSYAKATGRTASHDTAENANASQACVSRRKACRRVCAGDPRTSLIAAFAQIGVERIGQSRGSSVFVLCEVFESDEIS